MRSGFSVALEGSREKHLHHELGERAPTAQSCGTHESEAKRQLARTPMEPEELLKHLGTCSLVFTGSAAFLNLM